MEAIITPELDAVPTVRSRFPRGIAVAMGLVAIVSAVLAQHSADPSHVPLWVIVLSLLAIAGGALALPTPFPFREGVKRGIAAAPARAYMLAAAMLVLPTIVAVLVWAQEPFKVNHVFVHASSTWAALLWVVGMIGSVAVAWRQDPESLRIQRKQIPWLCIEGAALLLILNVALGLRLYHLSTLPEGVWFDEVDFANSAQLLRTLPFQPLGAFELGHEPSLYFYVMAVLLKFGGMTIAMVRSTSVLFGMMAVLGVYGIGRRVGGPALGLSAAALIAIGQWSVDFSRFGLSQIGAPGTISVGVLALTIGLQRPRPVWFTLSGVLMGLAMQTYQGAFIAGAGVAMVVLGIRLSIDRNYRLVAWPAVLLVPLGLLVGAAPLLTAIGLDSTWTLARLKTVSLFTEYQSRSDQINALIHNIRLHLLMFTIAGDNNGRHNLPGAPMLDPVTGACFLLGLGMCIRRITHWFPVLLLSWLSASLLGGILSLDFEAPQGSRTIGAIAPIALIAALPLALLAQLIWRAVYTRLNPKITAETTVLPSGLLVEGRFWRPQLIAAVVSAAVLLAPLGISFSSNEHQYFVAQATNNTAWAEMEGIQAILGREAAALVASGYSVTIAPELVGDSTVVFTAGGLNVPAFDPSVPVQLPVPPGGEALLIPSSDPDVISFLRESFPSAQFLPLTPNYNSADVEAYAVLVRPTDVAASLGVVVRFGSHQQALQHQQLPIAWPATTGPESTSTVQATLLVGSNNGWKPFAFRVIGAQKSAITIDGQTWNNGGMGTPLIRLGAGNHQLTITASHPSGSILGFQWDSQIESATQLPSTLGWTDVPNTVLAAPTMPTGGLLGLYFNGPTIGSVPVLARVDESLHTYYQNPPIPGPFPFAAVWSGSLQISQPGQYSFNLDSTGPSTLIIDGKTVVAVQAAPNTGLIELLPGPHTIRLEYSASGGYLHCYLTWAPPGQSFSTIPVSLLEPGHG